MSEKADYSFLDQPIEGRLRERLDEKSARFDELEKLIADPDAQQDRNKFQELLKEHGSIAPEVASYREYLRVEEELADAEQLAQGDDEEMKELAELELEELAEKRSATARRIREQILDQQVEGTNNAIVEIRAGAGGDEAALFAATVYKMYSLYAEKQRWKIEVLSSSHTALGGYKEITFAIKGKGAMSRMRFESGGHRVQRVPETETQGRIHTSAVTVAVLEEAEESEVAIEEKDIRVETFCASGPGGQKVNKTSSAVRLTHVPTGIVVSIQDEKSQHKNKAKALRVLRTRIKDKEQAERREKEDEIRRSLIGTGDRSDRIRTYNFPQSRVTDHRIGVSLYSLDRFVMGEMEEMFDRLIAHDREQRVQLL